MVKKILVALLFITITYNSINLYAEASTPKLFTDIPEKHWAIPNIKHLVDNGIINGFPDGSFKPDYSINVDSFIKMTIVALGHTDIKNGIEYWAKPYIDKAIQLGLITENQFSSYKIPITREQMSSIISKAIKNEDKSPYRNYVENHVKDFSSITYTYIEDVKDAYTLGIITGLPDGTFQPNNESTRAQASTIIHRMIDKEQRKPFEPEVDGSGDGVIGDETSNNGDNSVTSNDDTVEDYVHTIVDGKVVYSTEKIMKVLKEYPILENELHNNFYENNKILSDHPDELIRYGNLSIETENFVETFFSRDYTTLNKEKKYNELLWWFQSWWMYRNQEYAPADFVKLWLDETSNWKVQQELLFVTDSYRMIYGFNHGKAVRGRMYFKFDKHDNIDNIKYEFESPKTMHHQFDNLQFGKWYYVDVDVLMGNPASNAPVNWATSKYMLYTYHYLSKLQLVEGQ